MKSYHPSHGDSRLTTRQGTMAAMTPEVWDELCHLREDRQKMLVAWQDWQSSKAMCDW